MTDRRKNLIKLLTFVQNRFTNQDIMTITGFMTDDEVGKHIMVYAAKLNDADRSKLLEMLHTMNAEAV